MLLLRAQHLRHLSATQKHDVCRLTANTAASLILSFDNINKVFLVTMSEGPYPIPSRTRKSSPPEPMVLRARVRGRVGRCQVYLKSPEAEMLRGFSLSVAPSKSPHFGHSRRMPGCAARAAIHACVDFGASAPPRMPRAFGGIPGEEYSFGLTRVGLLVDTAST